MHRLNSDCWVWSPRPSPSCRPPQHSGGLSSTVRSHQEEEEEEEEESGEHPAVCCYTTGGEVISQEAEAQWSISDAPVHSGISCSSGLAGRGPGAPPSEQPVIVCDRGDLSQQVVGGCCWEGPLIDTQECVCVYGQREPEALGPCWPGSPYVYYGLRTNVVVGVEVVEEVAVEDTVEIITEDIYTEDLLHPELLQDNHLYPT